MFISKIHSTPKNVEKAENMTQFRVHVMFRGTDIILREAARVT